MADKQVSILKRDGTQSTFYSTYTSAIADAISDDVIQIWADLTEQITLKNGVDIWIMPGVMLDYNPASPGPTITDNNSPVECNIYGMGVIKNTRNITSSYYNTILISSPNSKITIECDQIENDSNSIVISCISSNAAKFYLKCNKVFGKRGGAIFLNNGNSDININVKEVVTGLENDINTGSSALITKGNGVIKIDEILCRNLGHCLSHRSGTITARIKKMTTVNNRSGNISTVHLNQGDNNQNLILYFDEINNIKGSVNSLAGIEVKQGTGIFIGRRIYSEDTETVIIGKNSPSSVTPNKLYVRCNEIICIRRNAVTVNNSVQQCFIQANYIEANYLAVLYSDGSGNFVLKNGTLKNKYSSTDAIGIGVDTNLTNITLINVKIISGNASAGRPINVGNSTQMNVFNFGLFTNAPLNASLALLKIGTSINYQYNQSSDLT